MNYNNAKIIEIIDEYNGNIDLFSKRFDEIKCEEKEMIVLKICSSNIKENGNNVEIMKFVLKSMEKKVSARGIYVAFTCALGYEKIGEFYKSLYYYEFCISNLPEAAFKYALNGMKYRVLSKAKKDEKSFKLSVEAFAKAVEMETIDWKKEKWKKAQEEMILQTERKWLYE